MLNMTTQDKNKPAEYIDQTYEALKYNPQATQQIMSEGANAGLAGIGAMAANRFQQKANMTQQSQQAQQAAQNPQPTVLQQLQMAAMQGGIMGQLPGAIQAQQAPPGGMGLGDLPVDPNALPQTMAGGGLVALAQGGDVRGFEEGGPAIAYDPAELEGYLQRVSPQASPWEYIKDAGSRLSNAVLPGYEQYRQHLGEDEDVAEDELAKLERYYGANGTTPSPAIRRRMEELRGGANGEVPTAQTTTENPRAQMPPDAVNLDEVFDRARKESNHLAQETAIREIKNAGRAAPDAEEAQRNIEEARRDRALDEGQAAPQMASQQGGLPAIQGQRTEEPAGPTAEEMRDQILALRGGAPAGMSAEERAWRKEQAESANTDKWLQTLTAIGGGVLAGGGRTWPEAIGQGALFGLNAYRRGAEEEGKAELGMLQAQSAYAEAQRKAQERAADEMFGTERKQMELRSAGQIARAKQLQKESQFQRSEIGKNQRAELVYGGRQQAEYNDKLDKALAIIANMDKYDVNYMSGDAKYRAEREAKVYHDLGISPPSQGLGGGMGLGTPSFRYTRASGLQSPSS